MSVLKKIGKIFIIILIILIILTVLLVLCYINHRVHLAEEEKIFSVIGGIREVNGHGINLYTEGEGAVTLVFMSGGGTCSPVLP